MCKVLGTKTVTSSSAWMESTSSRAGKIEGNMAEKKRDGTARIDGSLKR